MIGPTRCVGTPIGTPAPARGQRRVFEMKKPPNFGGLGERETGLEPATFSLGIAMVAAVGWGL